MREDRYVVGFLSPESAVYGTNWNPSIATTWSQPATLAAARRLLPKLTGKKVVYELVEVKEETFLKNATEEQLIAELRSNRFKE